MYKYMGNSLKINNDNSSEYYKSEKYKFYLTEKFHKDKYVYLVKYVLINDNLAKFI